MTDEWMCQPGWNIWAEKRCWPCLGKPPQHEGSTAWVVGRSWEGWRCEEFEQSRNRDIGDCMIFCWLQCSPFCFPWRRTRWWIIVFLCTASCTKKELLIRGQENQLLKGVGGLTDTDTTDVTSHILLLLSNKNACPVFFNYLGWLFCWCLVKAAGYLDPNVNFFATWFFMLMIVEWWCPVVLWFTIYFIIDGISMLTLMKQVVLYLSLQTKRVVLCPCADDQYYRNYSGTELL